MWCGVCFISFSVNEQIPVSLYGTTPFRLIPPTGCPVTARLQNESGEQMCSMENHRFSGGFVFCQMSSLKQLTSGLAIARSLDSSGCTATGGNKGCHSYSLLSEIQA